MFFISDGETFLCQDTNSLIVDSSWCFPVAVTYKKENEKKFKKVLGKKRFEEYAGKAALILCPVP